MHLRRIPPLLLLALGTAALIVAVRRFPPPGKPAVAPRMSALIAAENDTAEIEAARPQERPRPRAYAQAWADAAQPEAMAAFRAWTERWRAATPEVRAALLAEGVALARTRRAALLDLIKADPRRALELAAPAVVRRDLPAEIAAELEQRVAGRGELALVAASPAPGEPLAGPRVWRQALLGGVTYTAHVYGRREPQTALSGASLHGIALGRQLALHDSPVRALEPGEPIGAAIDETCPVTAEPVAAAAGEPASLAEIFFAEAEGRVVEFCGGADMIERYEQKLIAAEEDAAGGAAATPPAAGEPERPQSVGAKAVLVIRVDFSDLPGDPLTQAAALNVVGNLVRPFYEDMSYGKTTINGTVSDITYRMPQTALAYATANNTAQLHADARSAASAQYTMAQFDRIIVVFPRLTAVAGSQITFGGLGQINAPNIWINGPNSFTIGTVSHELGHTYGLLHSNLWRVTDGNPVSPAGISQEYGDAFDTMGSASVSGVTRDPRHHFNAWQKNRLGWLPDSAVTTVRTSGTYRIQRFDHRDAVASGQPLALRIFRDGVRWFWVGYRQNFATGTPQTNGAQVVWGYNNRQGSHLLDLVTPGASANDATLPIGSTFTDPVSGVSIKALARGGADPAQYLDVEVTVPAVARDVVAAWGREGAEFYDETSGLPDTPSPETFVPFNLAGVRAVAGGNTHALALTAGGAVFAWGGNASGQATVPAGLGEVAAIAAGGDVSGVVRRDGTVRLWGSAASGQTAPPAGLADVRQLALGATHALALRNDGTVVAWGANGSGQTTVPAGLADVIAVAAGNAGSVALRRDGTVIAWGGAAAFRAVPAGLANVVAISANGGSDAGAGTHVMALRRDGTVAAWGNNGNGQTTLPSGLNSVVAIAAGGFHSAVLKSDGGVVAWGSNNSFQAAVPPSLPRSFAIAASSRATFALAGSSVQFAAQPRDQTIALGGDVTLTVAATGLGAVAYQWRKDGANLAGATGATLTLRNVTAAQAGLYDVVVTDALGETVSAAGRLTVAAPVATEVARIGNLSIRTRAGTGAQTLIVGFVVGGAGTSGAKPLLVRGIGPALAGFGVAGALGDPKLEIYNAAAAKLFENDNWNAGDTATFASVGAFALTAGSRDAALYNGALASASYSAQVSGVGGTTGVALAEIYDATPPATFGTGTPRLINVSARALSGAGADVLIAGFVVSGPAGATKKVLIRAIGPTLTVFGVTGVLADPKLELFDSGAAKIQENDNWGGGAALADTFRAVGAFGLDGASRDAALVATLAPGSYTAQVSGIGGGTGVALVEVYDVP